MKMSTNFVGLFVVLLSVAFSKADDGQEPMVAFLCNQPAMYLADNGWVKDDNTGCLKDPADILNYCRKVFSTLDVRNVVEASQKTTISNWCNFGQTECNQQYTVTPFRCLVGPFQSDALLVPEGCIFDHIHDSNLCTASSEWNKTSVQSCIDRGMYQNSFAMLQPCGIDTFQGVEFVCCPTKQDSTTAHPKENKASTVNSVSEEKVATDRMNTLKDAFSDYINQKQSGHKWTEHEFYMKAKNDMRKRHHDKVAKMMNDWTAARQRVQDLKAIDSKASDKLNKEITSRFQKTYEAEEAETESEKKQLALLHEQRVQAELNDKRSQALDNYIDAIEDDDAELPDILKALKHYVKVLQKDRLHVVNHFRHLQDTNPADADANRTPMSSRIDSIDQQLQEALDMLDRLPKFKNKITQQIAVYLDSYHSIDESIHKLFSRGNAGHRTTTQATTSTTARLEDDEEYDDEDYEDEEVGEEKKDSTVEDTKKVDDKKVDADEDDSESEDSEGDEEDVKEKIEEEEKVESKDDDMSDDDEMIDDKEDKDDDDDDDESDDADDAEKKEDDKDEEGISTTSDGETSKDDEDDEDDDDADEDDDDDEEEAKDDKTTSSLNSATTSESKTLEEKSVLSDDLGDDGFEDKIEYEHNKHNGHAANVDKSYLQVKQPFIHKASSKGLNNFNAAVPLGITVGSLTVIVVIIVGVIVMRRRSRQRRPSRPLASSLNQDPAASPEERHVVNMQMNGYENPTYKYFESNVPA